LQGTGPDPSDCSRSTTDRNVIARDWHRRGFSCDLWVDRGGQAWRDFVHDVDELVLVVSGLLAVELPDRAVWLQPGDELLIPAGTRHSVRNLDERPVRFLYGYRPTA
jgi:mannose-6-phosphate isomerase-like protein (cupin superfamily)